MENNLTDFDITFIRLQLSKLSDYDIAAMIDKPEELVHEKIEQLTGGGTVKLSYSQRLSQNRKLNEKARAAKNITAIQKKQEKPVKILPQRDQQRFDRKKKEEEQRIPTREIDYTLKILIRIDARTQIYVDPSADIEKIKAEYLGRKNKIAKGFYK
jgi:hypothetical protein